MHDTQAAAMRLTRPMLWGGVLGAVVGVAGTVISLFQYDSEQTTVLESVAVGLLIGLPITTICGVLLGLLWGAVFRAGQGAGRKPVGSNAAEPGQPGANENASGRSQIGERQPGRRRKRNQS